MRSARNEPLYEIAQIKGTSEATPALSPSDEFDYTGKFGIESDAKHRLNGFPGQPPGQIQQIREFSSGGFAAVWAQENTRESIYDAMARKETVGTSGTHRSGTRRGRHAETRSFAGARFSRPSVRRGAAAPGWEWTPARTPS
jgi:hypothetical protein